LHAETRPEEILFYFLFLLIDLFYFTLLIQFTPTESVQGSAIEAPALLMVPCGMLPGYRQVAGSSG
jgi:hypothetical protein